MEQVLHDKSPSSKGPCTEQPLIVDLDGTLIKTDLLAESTFALLKQNPLEVLALPGWLLKGKAYFKRRVAQRAAIDVGSLPYHDRFLDYLKAQRSQGRRLVLATGSDELQARRVADHLQIFDLVYASDGITNLSGASKRDLLVREFGEKGFDYAGNDRRDLAVWSAASKAIVVNPKQRVRDGAARVAELEQVFSDPPVSAMTLVRELRLYQWSKSLLIFVPLLAAQRFGEMHLLAQAFLAFLAFGFCSSSVYLLNDLLDLPDDRRHPRKRLRPFAAGELSILSGLAMIPLLLGLSFLLSLFLPLAFVGVLAVYFCLTTVYSVFVKQIVILDVIVLAGLYTVRIMAGSAAYSIWPSSWLLAFSTFLFFSLALVKRYAELLTMLGIDGQIGHARGYRVQDMDLLVSMGNASGFLSVLVLALYIDTEKAHLLYGRHHLIWLLCPLLLYWIGYIWLTAHRGRMYDDPLVFALKDRVSLIVFLCMIAIFVLAM
jgi:4-hydroxybenzoate polyprenyltransferase/phosphoserine phosphatase